MKRGESDSQIEGEIKEGIICVFWERAVECGGRGDTLTSALGPVTAPGQVKVTNS